MGTDSAWTLCPARVFPDSSRKRLISGVLISPWAGLTKPTGESADVACSSVPARKYLHTFICSEEFVSLRERGSDIQKHTHTHTPECSETAASQVLCLNNVNSKQINGKVHVPTTSVWSGVYIYLDHRNISSKPTWCPAQLQQCTGEYLVGVACVEGESRLRTRTESALRPSSFPPSPQWIITSRKKNCKWHTTHLNRNNLKLSFKRKVSFVKSNMALSYIYILF